MSNNYTAAAYLHEPLHEMFSSADDMKKGPGIVWVIEAASSQDVESPIEGSNILMLDATTTAGTVPIIYENVRNNAFQFDCAPGETLSTSETKDVEPYDPPTTIHGYRFAGNFEAMNKATDKKMFYADNNERFDGVLRNGMRHGYGISSCSDGNSYDGEFQNDEPNGFGKRTYADGRRFEGTYKNGKRQGGGTMFFSSGKHFNGRYVDDLAEGFGTYDNPSKDLAFKGTFTNGVAHGQGTSYDGTGGCQIGEYIDGHRRGWFRWIRRNGDVSEFEC
jgi:hypothetical protein